MNCLRATSSKLINGSGGGDWAQQQLVEVVVIGKSPGNQLLAGSGAKQEASGNSKGDAVSTR